MNKLDLRTLVEKNEDIAISIYIKTFRTNPENQQSITKLKNNLKKAESILSERGIESESFLEKAYELIEDNNFWYYNDDGLAILIDKNDTYIFNLNGNIKESFTVSENFHLLPLLNYYEIPNDYYFLDLSKDSIGIYSYKNGILNKEDTEIYEKFNQLFSDKDNEIEGSHTRGASNSFHNYHTSSSEDEKNREKYFRYLNDELKDFLKNKEEKLILFGTTENISEFVSISDIELYESIDKPFDSIESNELYNVLKDNLINKYIDSMKVKVDNLMTSIANEKGSDNFSRILNDSKSGKISELYISSNFDQNDDLDKLISTVLLTSGEIYLINPELNNFNFNVAAKYRY